MHNNMPTDTFDVVDFVVNKGHGVSGLAKMGLKSVPDQYIQPVEERLESLKLVTDESIPTINVCNWEDQTICDAICNASKKYGFFQIINHGIPMEVLEEIQAAAHHFFQLPTEEKVKYKADVFKSGTAKLETSFSPSKEKILEWKDYLSMHYVDHETASASWPPVCKVECYKIRRSSGKHSVQKVFIYFPVTPRLQRLYASKSTAEVMRWHAENPRISSIMAHPYDGEAWKHLDVLLPDFAAEPWNVWLGLCTDGFSPFGRIGKQYSCWPVILTPYNLLPWLYMKRHFMLLTLIIPGPKSPKGNVDVFLQLLIEELKEF
ncbi:hypothetical protein Ancab_040329 [Ancistrocladus abbreviatus]